MNKSLKYLLVAFGILLFLYFINQGQQNKYIGTSETIFDLEADIINKIILKDSSGESITLFKTDSIWSIFDND
jgi:heme/copper-type cytochrome/quinol oxidase subunit 3